MKLCPLLAFGDFILDGEQYSCDRYVVWQGHLKKTDQEVSLKIFEKKLIEKGENKKLLDFEVNSFKTANCPFIASFVDFLENEEFFAIVLEPLQGGSLGEFLDAKTRLNESFSKQYFVQLFMIIDYFEKVLHLIHGSLSLDCFMLTESNVLKLIDFWGAREIGEKSEWKEFFNPVFYRAPEVFLHGDICSQTDLWCASVIAYRVVTGDFPFGASEDEKQTMKKVTESSVSYPSFLSRSLVDLMHKVLYKNPLQRVHVDELKQHPWFSSSQMFELLQQLTYKELVYNSEVMESISDFVGEEDVVADITHYNAEGAVTPCLSIYKIADTANINQEVLSVLKISSTPVVPIGESRRMNSSMLYLTNSVSFSSQPLLQIQGKSISNEKFKLKPLIISQARPVQIAARRGSRSAFNFPPSIPKK